MPTETRKSVPNWTAAQKLAIETTGASLLVSAAAGSGKTAVLAERCAYLICDATPPCDADQLLVVTFTEAAAAEMKSRIGAALANRLNREPHNLRLQTQVALIDRAQVSTLHGFCSRLLRQHFHLIGLDPSFKILDGDEATLLKNEVVRELFHDRYEAQPAETDAPTALDTPAFLRFIDDYGEGQDEGLRRQVIDTHDLIASLISPEKWMKAARAKVEEALTRPLAQSTLGCELMGVIRRKLKAITDNCATALETIKRQGGFGTYVNYLAGLQSALTDWQTAFGDGNLDALAAAVHGLQIPNLPSVSKDTPGKDAAQAIVRSVKEQMTKDGSLAQMLRFSASQWIEGMGSIQSAVDVFLDLVSDFGSRYRAAKQRIRSLDFNDLERLTLRVLADANNNPSDVARLCHRQLHHVLVDEYQDINEVQDRILCLVSRECITGQHAARKPIAVPNLFCVGDVKQSIYGFRLADPAQFMEREDRYRGGDAAVAKVVDLQQNFRSRGPLLEAINALFCRLMTREAADIEYDQLHHLRLGATFPKAEDGQVFEGAPVELHLLPPPQNIGGPNKDDHDDDDEPGEAPPAELGLDRTQREATFIANRIEELMGHRGQPAARIFDKDLGQYRPLRYSDVAILLRSMKFKAEQMADVLRQHGVPVYRASGAGYFNSMEIRDMVALLSLLDNSLQDIPLAAVLRSPFAGIARPEDAMARIRLAYPGGEQPIAFHEAAARYATEQSDELAARLNEFFDRLQNWRTLARQRPLADLVWNIYDQSGYLTFCSGLPGGEQRCANLRDFHERAMQFGGFARQGLYRFLNFLDALKNQADVGQPSIAGEGEDVVRVLSVHKAKGLEFGVVFIADLGKRINTRSAQGPLLVERDLHLGLKVVDELKQVRYPSLSHVLVERRLKRQLLAEELRILYVAMTRAKEHLIMVGTCAPEKLKKWDSMWITHQGPFSAEAIHDAATVLDWIVPATIAMKSALPGMFERTMHEETEVVAWADHSEAAAKPSDRLGLLAKLAPLNPAPPPNSLAQAVINRIGARDAKAPFTQLRASISVTSWSKRGQDQTEIAEDHGQGVDEAAAGAVNNAASASVNRLALPAFLTSGTLFASTISAADIGTATHLVLQHLDFHRPCRAADLTAQIQKMIDRKLITTEQAGVIDRPAIEWFAGSDIGQMLAGVSSDDLFREIPFNFAVPPEQFGAPPSSDPLDQVMLRGRIDLLVRRPDGFHVIDYKTDRVWGAELEARRDYYAGQVRLYRDAITRFTSQPVAAIHLVFLAPRVICQV